MPEYLAPGVYVEEIDTGSKPIEGVSTSTAGMVGVTERGPVNVPILITGIGEYTRWFGERLNILDFSDPNTGHHCYLPHAVEGFLHQWRQARLHHAGAGYRPGGSRRVFSVRSRRGHRCEHRGTCAPVEENTGTAANLPLLLVLPDAELAQDDWIRIGDGSDAEYRLVTVNPVQDTVAVALSLPLSHSHADSAAPISVDQITPGAPLEIFTLVAPAPATRIPRGEQTIEITGAQADLDALIAAATPPLEIIENAAANLREHRFALQITRLSPTNARVLLDSPLRLSYANNATVNHMDLTAAPVDTANLDPSARAGDSLLFVDNRGVNFDTRTDVVVIAQANNPEVRRIGELRQVTFTTIITEAYQAGTLVESVNLEDDDHITMNAAGAGTAP